ncbi:MAG TPA: T9SS type A sorting domain-containing protein, partial [Bacteroidales bacterium]
FTVSPTASSGLPVTLTSGNTNFAAVSGNTITIVMPGTVTITASQAGNSNYLAANNATQSLTINKAAQTITFPALPVTTFKNTDPNQPLLATASSGLNVNFKSSDLSVAITEGFITNGVITDSLHFYGAGTSTISAIQLGNDYYAAADPVSQTITVTSTTKVPQLADGELAIYPNPVSDQMTISLEKMLTNASVSVYSLTGQLVSSVQIESTRTDIDVSSLKPGIYIVKIMSSEGISVKQIVKQ